MFAPYCKTKMELDDFELALHGNVCPDATRSTKRSSMDLDDLGHSLRTKIQKCSEGAAPQLKDPSMALDDRPKRALSLDELPDRLVVTQETECVTLCNHSYSQRQSSSAGFRRSRRPRKQRGQFAKRCGEEFKKHRAFRRDNGLVSDNGEWVYSEKLSACQLPPMGARQRDVLHIIWLLFERRGIDPSRVQQAWMLCQSIYRKPKSFKGYHKGTLSGATPNIPGLCLNHNSACNATPVAPCILPRCNLWLNSELAFASGAQCLQLQGVHVPSFWPSWRSRQDGDLRQVAGLLFFSNR